jgi:hypothetical protein
MDDLCHEVNYIKTECKHEFHASCLMKNVSINGFGCPYCRTSMAEEPAEEEEEEEEEDDEEATVWEEDDEDEEEDNMLRGFRLFFANVENSGIEETDMDAEIEYQGLNKPSAADVARRLAAQGVTMEKLVKVLLLDHDEYEQEEEEFEAVSDSIWENFRQIISNWNPDQVANNEPMFANVTEKNETQEIIPAAQDRRTRRQSFFNPTPPFQTVISRL